MYILVHVYLYVYVAVWQDTHHTDVARDEIGMERIVKKDFCYVFSVSYNESTQELLVIHLK